MKKNLTELVFILDRSGSMHGLEKETIGGFNSLIEKQKREDGEAIVSLLLFDHECDVIYDRAALNKIPEMTEKEYYTRGRTAMLDAVGGAVHHIKNVHKYAREEDVPEKALFIITTDGLENASCRYSYEKVKELIEEQKAEHNWEFLFLGANIDAAETAVNIGISRKCAAEYRSDSEGTVLNYDVISRTVSLFRNGDGIQEGWKSSIEADMLKSKK